MSKDKEILTLVFQGLSNSKIATQLRVSRNTVAKVKTQADLNGLTTTLLEAMDEQQVHDFLFPPKEETIFYVQPDLEYIHKETKKSGVTLKLLWKEYIEQCQAEQKPFYKYSFFCELYHNYVEEHKLVAHLVHKPGDKTMTDYVGDHMYFIDPKNSKKVVVNIFVASLPYSGLIYAEGSLKMDEEAWINAHIRMWDFFGGVTKFIVPDNLKQAVISHKKYEDIIYNPTYIEMCNHYGVAPLAARVRRPRDKGHVESAVNIVERNIIAKYRNYKFTSLLEVNMAIQDALKEINDEPFQKKEGCRNSVFNELEKPYLNPLPKFKYEYAISKKAKVQPNCHIAFSYNNYSVPYNYAKRVVTLKITDSRIDIYCDGKLIASHKRLYGRRYQYSTVPEHLPSTHRMYSEYNKARYFRQAKMIGPNAVKLVTMIFEEVDLEEKGYNTCFCLLGLADDYGNEKFESALESIFKYSDTRPIYRQLKAVLSSDTELYTGKKLKGKDDGDSYACLRGKDYYD